LIFAITNRKQNSRLNRIIEYTHANGSDKYILHICDYIEQIWKAAGSETCDCREEPLQEFWYQYTHCDTKYNIYRFIKILCLILLLAKLMQVTLYYVGKGK
ncbi:hypothetical protein ACJX0J_007892, partial [Zea mays]